MNMWAKNRIKQVMPRAVLKRAGDFRRRVRNAATTFSAGEGGYHLAIQEVDGYTITYRTGTADLDVLGESFSSDTYFSTLKASVPGFCLRPDDVIIDVGSHIGTFALLAAKKVPSGRIISFEASIETYNYLRVNLALNHVSNVVPIHLALADGPGSTVLHHDAGSWGHSIMKPSRHGEEVAKDSLPNLMTTQQITEVGLIKFNCEGAEFPILLNTPAPVMRQFRVMLILYHLDMVQGYTRGKLLNHLKDSNFVSVIVNEGGQRGWIIAWRA
jgi:FkbM family methyltransferase